MKPRKTVYRGHLVDLGIEHVKLPNGRQTDLEIVRHPGGAAVVAIDERQRVCLLRQYRHAAGGWLWELPAGKIDAGETPETTASRELAEEAGILASELVPLGQTLTTPGFCDEVIYLFRATGLQSCATRQEDHEVIEIHWLDYQEALRGIHDGTIRDAKTMLGLLLARL